MGTWGIGAGTPVGLGEGSSCDPGPANHGSGIDPERRMPLKPVTRPPSPRSRMALTNSAKLAQERKVFLLALARNRRPGLGALSLSAVRPMATLTSSFAMARSRARLTQRPGCWPQYTTDRTPRQRTLRLPLAGHCLLVTAHTRGPGATLPPCPEPREWASAEDPALALPCLDQKTRRRSSTRKRRARTRRCPALARARWGRGVRASCHTCRLEYVPVN
jgi:hypothetical protein